uniref:F-box domain-containing protein n=1 Tax=Ditylenchus dipsaci TaxID=166011 RepID=A0A915DSZ5_9BILA
MENFVALADDTLLTILQNFSPHQILQTIQPSCKRLIYLCYRLDQVPIYAACPSYLNPSNNQPGRYLYASQVAQVLSAQLSAQEDIKSSIEISDLVSYLPNAYHSRKPLWFFFILRVGEIVFDQKLTSFESLSLTSTAESLFSRTFNAIRKLRRFRQEQLIAKKINRKEMQDLFCKHIPIPIL